MQSKPNPTKKNNPCPACGDNSGKCRTFDDRDLILCMNSDRAPGLRFIGNDKSGLWHQLVPENSATYQPQPRLQVVDQDPPMSLSDRHAWYENFLESKKLSERDRADLTRRGLSDDEIDELPIVSSELGYAVIFRGLDGLFVGAQWRIADPGDGARYKWQNLPGGKQFPGTGEMPIAVYPIDRPRGIALVEGLGVKPYLAAKRLQMIAIGAAGGLHTSSPTQLRQILLKYRDLPVVVVPDAGDVKNPQVMQRHARTEAMLQDMGVKAKFLWWNQLTKDHDDVDEASEDELDTARTVNFKALANLQNDHAFHETLDQIDLLRDAIADPLQRDWVLQNFAVENGLKSKGFNGATLAHLAQARKDAATDLEIVDAHDILEQEQAPKFIVAGHLLEGTVTVLAANGGSGKTTLLYDFAKAIATGHPWSHYPTRQGRCLIVQTDEPRPNIKQKLEIAKFQGVPRGSVEFLTRFRFTQFEKLADRIRRENYTFVVIDSWTAAHAGTGVDLTKSTAGENAYLLRDLAEETGCAIVIVHHLNRMGDLRDSTTLFDNVSEVWKLSKGTPEDKLLNGQRILSIEKSRSDLQGKYILEQNAANYSWVHLGEMSAPDVSGQEPLIGRIFYGMTQTPGKSYSVSEISKIHQVDYHKAETDLERLRRQGAIKARWIVYEEKGFWSYAYTTNVHQEIEAIPEPRAIAQPSKPAQKQVQSEPEISPVIEALIDESVDAAQCAIASGTPEIIEMAIAQLSRLTKPQKRMVWDRLTTEEQQGLTRICKQPDSAEVSAESDADCEVESVTSDSEITECDGFRVGDRVELTLERLDPSGLKDWLKTQKDIRGLQGEIVGIRPYRNRSPRISVRLDDGTIEETLTTFMNHATNNSADEDF